MFTEEEKAVFRYFDGSAWKCGDPLSLKRRLYHALGGDPNAAFEEMNSDIPQVRFAAEEKVLLAVRDVFKMTPFDESNGGGAKEKHCLDALDALLAYLGEQKKNSVTSPTSLPPTEASGQSARTTKPTSV